jgi:hypothetical protein
MSKTGARKMKTRTVVVGLLLAFLLFTPQGQEASSVVAEMALYAATPAPEPAKLAAEAAKKTEKEACARAWYAKARASSEGMPSSYYYFVTAGGPPC